MPDKATVMRTVEAAYAARMRGDKEALFSHFAPGATYRLAGNGDLLPAMPVAPQDARVSIGLLVDQFTFSEVEHVATLVDDDRAVVHLRVKVSKDGSPPTATELLDLWRFDADGRVATIAQFADTALIAHMLAGNTGPG